MPSTNSDLLFSPRADKAGRAAVSAGEVGRALRVARAKIGMTRKQLARASGASERYLALLEAGEGNPTLGVLVALAAALDTALIDLLPQGGERNPAMARLAAAVRRLPDARRAALERWIADGAGAAPPSAKAGRIVLIGLRGAGKTTLGTRLAARRRVPFLEISKLVEDGYGGDIGLLLEMSGQAALRRHEGRVWEEICRTHDHAVIAAPGGIVADPVLYDRILATAHTVWLRADPEDHMSRVMAQGDFRPMASNRGAMSDLKAILDARGADYARAETTVETSGVSEEEALARLATCAGALVDETGDWPVQKPA